MDILARLRQLVPDAREIDAVLWNACGRCTRRLSQGKVQYISASDSTTIFATVKFRRGRIVSLDPGPALHSLEAREALFERAAHESAQTHGTKIGPRILKLDFELRGTIRWSNVFRLDPLHASIPTEPKLDWIASTQSAYSGPKTFGPPYPVALQVSSPASPNPVIEIRRHFEALETAQNLISLLIIGRLRPLIEDNERVWSLLNNNGRMENHLVFRGFNSPTMPEFNSVVTQEAPQTSDDRYFERWEHEIEEITVPTTFATDVAMAHSLDRDHADAFRRAIHWFSLGLRNRTNHSLSLLAFSTAVECLLPQTRRQRCAACGSALGPGPTQLFKRHVFEYGEVPPNLPDLRARIYDARSALIHGSFSVATDNVVPTSGGDSEEEYSLVEHVTRTSLINWLRRHARVSSAA